MNQKIKNTIVNSDVYYLLVFFFILTFGYLYWFGDYVLFLQEKQSLFLFTDEYLHQYLTLPGGLLEFAGNYLTTFYIDSANGALILAVIITLPAIIFFNVTKQLFNNQSFALFFSILPSLLLLLMQTHYYHLMEYNLGYIVVSLYFLLAITARKKYVKYILLAVFPILYYLAGAYVWIFVVMYIFYSLLYEGGMRRYMYPGALIAVAGISLLVFKMVLFLQPLEQLFQYPLPLIQDPRHSLLFYVLTGYVVLYPLFGRLSNQFKLRKKYRRPVSLVSTLLVLGLCIFMLSKLYNSQTRRVIQIQKYVYAKEWEKAIAFHEKYPSRNLIGQYFYNIALSETDQLCNRLFYGQQDFGPGSIVLPWGNEHLRRGGYFYYAIGLINEAQRWAYEDMVVNGYSPQNLKLLSKTCLINGDYRMAEKYLGKLKKSRNYKEWAENHEIMLHHPERVKAHSELGEKVKLLPEEDFFIRINSPQDNIPELLKANPDNRKVFEYKMAWYLLSKNVEPVTKNIKKMKELGYKQIPRHVEEAALAYLNSTGELPDMGGFTISQSAKQRFNNYASEYKGVRQNSPSAKEKIRNEFRNTFWFYYHFKNLRNK